MPGKREIWEQIEVIVELSPTLERFAKPEETVGKKFYTVLEQYLNDLFTGLMIPASLLLTIKVKSAEKLDEIPPYFVSINKSHCRLSLLAAIEKEISAAELAKTIIGDVYRNRELLITEQLAKKMQMAWCYENDKALFTHLSTQSFHEFVLEFIRRGFSLEKGKGADQDYAHRDLNPANCFEEAISGLETVTIKIFCIHKAEFTKAKSDADGNRSINDQLEAMQESFFDRLGLMLPRVDIEVEDGLQENEFRIQLNDVRFPPVQRLNSNKFLVNATTERLDALGIKGDKAINPTNDSECTLVRNDDGALENCLNKGLQPLGPAGYIAQHLTAAIQSNAGNFLTREIVKFSMDRLKETHPELVDAALKRFGYDLATLTRILRELLDEEISIRNLRGILESLLAIQEVTDADHSKYLVFHSLPINLCPVSENKELQELSVTDYVTCVRIALKRQISYENTLERNTLLAYYVNPAIETWLTDYDKNSPSWDNKLSQLIKAILQKMKRWPPTDQKQVILTSVLNRKRLKTLIEKEFPRCAILSYQEIAHDIIKVQWLGQISLSE